MKKYTPLSRGVFFIANKSKNGYNHSQRGDIMIVKQDLTVDADGNVRLRNVCNAQSSLDLARMARENNPDGWFGDKNGECRLLGYIPEEMFSFNPWLMQAKKAEREGDMGKKEYYISKFFELFPAFAGNKKTKYWRGHRAVLL